MKQFHVYYSANARKALRKLDPGIRNMILKWIDKNLDGCTDARVHGKALTGNLAGLWRYRIGDCLEIGSASGKEDADFQRFAHLALQSFSSNR